MRSSISQFLLAGTSACMLATAAYAGVSVTHPSNPALGQTAFYVSGGIGEMERIALQEMESDYNLKLEMALSSGHYIANSFVTVSNARGETVISTTADGPLFYANLEPGTYTVEAAYEGAVKTQKVTIGSADRLRDLHFIWNDDAQDS
tara:strand:- start:318 stop:761 length:444 start_codon:yes stop_codon:yes gene_type:complete